MKKACPDLVGLDDESLRKFWKSHRPKDLKRLGDRLLAESLPRFAPRSEDFYPGDLAQRRQALNLSLTDMAQQLNINPSILASWESGEVRPPASLPLIYAWGSDLLGP